MISAGSTCTGPLARCVPVPNCAAARNGRQDVKDALGGLGLGGLVDQLADLQAGAGRGRPGAPPSATRPVLRRAPGARPTLAPF